MDDLRIAGLEMAKSHSKLGFRTHVLLKLLGLRFRLVLGLIRRSIGESRHEPSPTPMASFSFDPVEKNHDSQVVYSFRRVQHLRRSF
jgi:hypothetical protein